MLTIRHILQSMRENSSLQNLGVLLDLVICGLPTGTSELTKYLKPCLHIFSY